MPGREAAAVNELLAGIWKELQTVEIFLCWIGVVLTIIAIRVRK